MREEIGDYIVCDLETARKVWNEEKEKRPFIWIENEFRASLTLDTADILKIEERKKDPKGFVFKKGMEL
jgi:hypothetical protein